MPADILIYALVAAGLIFWLRSVLGTRHGSERERPNPFTAPAESASKNGAAKDTKENSINIVLSDEEDNDLKSSLPRNMTIADSAETGLKDILKRDRNWEPASFLQAAQDAFIIIVESFADGDKETLKDMLSSAVYNAFEKVIDQREKDGEKATTEIHGIRKTEIQEALLKENMAYITVRFTADETSILRDKKDKVINGNPDRITETIDIWTFGRDTKSRDPRWFLYQTREDEEDEVSGSTVPETDAG